MKEKRKEEAGSGSHPPSKENSKDRIRPGEIPLPQSRDRNDGQRQRRKDKIKFKRSARAQQSRMKRSGGPLRRLGRGGDYDYAGQD